MAKMISMLNEALAHMERCTTEIATLYNSFQAGHGDPVEVSANLATLGVELAVHTAAMFLIRDQINGAANGRAPIDTVATVKANEGLN